MSGPTTRQLYRRGDRVRFGRDGPVMTVMYEDGSGAVGDGYTETMWYSALDDTFHTQVFPTLMLEPASKST